MRIGFIGSGKMAEAIMAAIINAKLAGPHEVFASDVNAERRRMLKSKYGINAYTKNRLVAAESPVLLLAVKPQNLADVLPEIAPVVTASHLVISIAAGKRLDYFRKFLPEARLVRVMPNMPAMVREGMSVFCTGETVSVADKQTVSKLLGSFGRVLELPESLFDGVTALSGSGPAFFAYLLDNMVQAAVAEGLTRSDALLLAEQTMLGTARVLLEQQVDPEGLMTAVASPGGTTEAGLVELRKSTIGKILAKTLSAATRRSRELSQ